MSAFVGPPSFNGPLLRCWPRCHDDFFRSIYRYFYMRKNSRVGGRLSRIDNLRGSLWCLRWLSCWIILHCPIRVLGLTRLLSARRLCRHRMLLPLLLLLLLLLLWLLPLLLRWLWLLLALRLLLRWLALVGTWRDLLWLALSGTWRNLLRWP